MTFAEAFNPALDASFQLTSGFGQAWLIACGDKFENITLRNTDIIKGINKRYDPFLKPLQETMETRKRIINDPRTSAGERAAQQRDLNVEKKRHDKIMDKKKGKLEPFVRANNAYNDALITLGAESQLFRASTLRDRVFHWDRTREELGEGAGQQSGATAFAPGMGYFAGAGGAQGGGGGARGGGK